MQEFDNGRKNDLFTKVRSILTAEKIFPHKKQNGKK